ncbi:hypothetical protein ciss_07460 [Carboxydothermus islandicus]|uniref:Uncharacterized protein n=1 Tax=Carboxydothermus islandicus TaxID=661089 RepID=A0A1L8D0Z6_9THEO|nr:contractile injection system protein, VgrG/Pvc8 family [Carboxydothermus islandicus]GAV24813.1 hypothetical protein ciss_07460 [Carboxydothermus islandicus]
MAESRRAKLYLKYNKRDISADLSPYLLSFSYTDYASGKADDLQITLEDKAGIWNASWMPEKGATLSASLIVQHWEKEGTTKKLPLGTFEVDEIECSGPPNVVTIKAVSVPVSSSLRGEDKTKAWEKTRLSVIAKDIAKNAGLKLLYDTNYNPTYDRIEQTAESDLSFLLRLCEDAGLALKITNKQIVIFDESKYEKMAPITTITRGKSPVISYDGVSATREVYSAARVEYEGRNKKVIKYTYRPPNRPKTGKMLIINERVSSLAEAINLAKMRLRQQNKEEVKFSLTMLGDIRLVAGVTVMIKGWGKFDGKYFVETAEHSGPGYTIRLELRRVLEGY